MATEPDGEDKGYNLNKVASVVLGLYLTASISIYAFMFTALQNIQLQLAGIEANSFTIADGIALRERLASSERALGRLPDAFPPTWFMNDYKTFKEELLELTKRFNILDKEVSKKCK